MTNTRFSALNDNELKLACGGSEAKPGAACWSLLEDSDNGSVYTNSDTDPRFPNKA